MTAWTHHDPAVRRLIREAQVRALREAARALPGIGLEVELAADWLNKRANRIEEER